MDRAAVYFFSENAEPSARCGLDAEDRLENIAGARSLESGKAYDFASSDAQADVVETAARVVFQLEDGFS